MIHFLAAAEMSSKPLANTAAWVVIVLVLVCLLRAVLWVLGWR
jgi:hypothetical protein